MDKDMKLALARAVSASLRERLEPNMADASVLNFTITDIHNPPQLPLETWVWVKFEDRPRRMFVVRVKEVM